MVCVGLLPASFVFNLYMAIRAWIIFKMNSAPKQHEERVKEVQRQVGGTFLQMTVYYYLDWCRSIL